MKTRFSVDILSGDINRTLNGAPVADDAASVLTARDVLACEVVFTSGATDVTATVLSGTRQLRLGLRQHPGSGPLLAVSGAHTMVAGVANCVFSLNTSEIVALLASFSKAVRSTRVYFEVEVGEVDASYRQTISQRPFTLAREVNMTGDEPPPAAEESAGESAQSAEEAAASAAAALASAQASEASNVSSQGSAVAAAASASAANTSKLEAASSQAFAAQSETNAAASESAAAASATAAEDSATNANTSKNAAATSATAAANSASAANASQLAAANSANNASVSATAAATSQSAAATSATNAAASQGAAAASAALAAAIANYTTFKGQTASVPATSTAAGDLYLVSAAHTAQSKTWAINDIAIYNGTSGSWSQVPGAIWMGMNAATRNALAPRGGLAFDGATGARVVAGLTNQNIGTGDFSVVLNFTVPATASSAQRGLLMLSAIDGTAGASSFSVALGANNLVITAEIRNAGNNGALYATFDASGYAGKPIQYTFTRSGAVVTGAVNGSVVTLSSSNAGSSIPLWSDSITSTYLNLGVRSVPSSFTGTIFSASLYNLALSAADVLEIYELGGEVPERYKFGSQVGLATDPTFSAFTGTADDGTADTFTNWYFGGNLSPLKLATGIRILVGASFAHNTSGSNLASCFSITLPTFVANNRKFMFRVRARAIGDTTKMSVTAGRSGVTEQALTASFANYLIFNDGGAGTQDLAFRPGGLLTGGGTSAGGGGIEIESLQIYYVGAVAHYRCTDNTSTWVRDSSTNALHATRTAGVTPVFPFDHEAFRDVAMPYTATKQPAKCHLSDGATSNRGLIQGPFVAGSRGWLAGAPVAEWCGWVTVPSSPVASGQGVLLAAAASSASPGVWPTVLNAALTVEIPGANNGQNGNPLWINCTTDTSNRRWFNHPTFRSIYSGQRIWLEILLTRGTSNPVVRVNGVDISAAFTDVGGLGTQPEWLHAALVSTYHVTGYNWPSGELPSGAWLTGHLTSAESLSWMITGQPPAWVQAGGHPGWADFYNGYFGQNITLNGITSVSTGFDNLALTGTASAQRNNNFQAVVRPLVIGAKYRISYTKDAGGIRLATGGSLTAATAGFTEFALNTTAGNFVIEFIYTGLAAPNFYNVASETPAVTITNITFRQIGALSLLTPQAIPVAHDWTEIGGNDARCVGVRGVTEDPNWIITTDTTSAAAGGQAVLGGDILSSTRDVIDSIIQIPSTGTPTTSVGHATGSLATYKASGALASGLNPLTLATRKLSANQVWIYQSTTDRLRTTIKGHRAN